LLILSVAAMSCRSPTDAPPEIAAVPVPDANPPAETIIPSVRCATDLGRFGGLQWKARTQGLSGPGPNVWSACHAWLDTDGMHLRLDQVNGVWTSAEVYTTDVMGYGRFEFEVATPLHALDPNVVFGMFTYPGGGQDGLHEIDIEVARFGATAAGAANLVYGAYSSVAPRGTRRQCTQRWELPAAASVHRFLWSPTDVTFQSFAVTSIFSTTIPDRSWRLVPSGTFRISSGTWPLYLNLWLYLGKAPTNGQPVEVVIRRVTYVTSLPTTPVASTTCP
jgi:hypothetical protein